MSNVWLKNKAVVWVLVFVFLFTSVFNTGTAFAETAGSNAPVAASATNPDGEEDARVTSLDLQENGMTIGNENRVFHMIFTLEGSVAIDSAWVHVHMLDLDESTSLRTYDVEPTGNENEYIATFELDSYIEGRCAIDAFDINDTYAFYCYDDEGYYKYKFDVAVNYSNLVVINELDFADDFNGVVEFTDEITSVTVPLTLDVEKEEGRSFEALDLCFANNESGEVISKQLLYNEETGKFSDKIEFEIRDRFTEGTYTLKYVRLNGEKKVLLKSDNMLTFTYKNSHTDRDIPVLNDVYFTLDGAKVSETGFNVTDGQELKVYLDISDDSAIEADYCWIELRSGYDIHDLYFEAVSGEEGIYESTADLWNMAEGEWYINRIRILDKYWNEVYCKQINGEKLADNYFFLYGENLGEQKHYYDVGFEGPGLNQYTSVYTKRITSFSEFDIEIPEPREVINAQFLGWETEDGTLISDNNQKFSMDVELSNNFTAKYDKPLAAVNIRYQECEAELYFGVDEGITWGEFKEMLKNDGYLTPYENDYEGEVFSGWYIYTPGYDLEDNDEFIPVESEDGYLSVYASAEYRMVHIQQYTFDAKGGTFADGSTAKTVDIDWNDGVHINGVEKPTREGYVFAGWRDADGCIVTHPSDSCTDKLYARWVDASDASVSYGKVQYTTDKTVTEETYYDDYWIWEDETTSRVTLPYHVNPDHVKLYVKLLDGSVVKDSIELDEGTTEVTYESVSADGSNTVIYTVYIDIEEPPTTLYNTEIQYYKDGECYGRVFDFDGTEATVTVPYNFDSDKEITFCGRDIDGNWIETKGVVMGDADEVTLTYISLVNDVIYTLKVVREEPDSTTGCEIAIRTTIGESVETKWYYSDETEDGVFNAKVPYGTFEALKNSEENSVLLRVLPYSSYATVDIEEVVDEEYREYLVLNADGTMTKEFTVTAQNGDTREYKVNIEEESGNSIELRDMEVGFWDNETYNQDWDDEMSRVETYFIIDLAEAATEDGTTVNVPYFYDNEEGFTIFYMLDAGSVSGISQDERYYLDDTGKLTLEFTATSANGENTQHYKVHFVKDMEGAGTAISRLQTCWWWYDYETDEMKQIKSDIDPETAKSEAGADIYVPVGMLEDSYEMWIAADSDNYSRFEKIAGYDSGWPTGSTVYSFGHIYEYFAFGEDGETWEFSVTSPDKQTKETYKFNIIPVDIPECEDHTYDEWYDTEDGMMYSYCTVCGHKGEKPAVDEHEHVFTNWVTVEEPDCDNAGKNVRMCSICEYAEEELIPAEGHDLDGIFVFDDKEHWDVCPKCLECFDTASHEIVETVTIEPDCETPGEKEYTCKHCDYLDFEEIPATGHKYVSETVGPTCTEAGYTTYTCDCGDSYEKESEPALGHDYESTVKEPTCTEAGYTTNVCKRCHDSYIDQETPAKDHYYSDWMTVTEATCETEGLESRQCTSCGMEEQVTIPATGHEYIVYETVEPTCTEAGYITYKCACGDSYVEEGEPALGHDLDGIFVFDDKEHWDVCPRCEDCFNTAAHEIVETVTIEPGCETPGEKEYTCKHCDYLDIEEIPALGHKLVKHKGKAATCTAKGYKAYEDCSRCDYTTYKAIAAKGHKWESFYTIDKKATTKAAGSKSKHCATCNTVKSGSKVTIAKISKTTVNTLVYNGKNRTQNVTVVNSKGKKLVKGTDFTVTYKNAKGTKVVTPKNVGTYKAVIKFKGMYSGTVTKTFKINPQETKITKLTKNGKKQFTVKWTKKTAQVTGYQIRYSMKQNMSNAKTVTVKNAKTTSKTIKQLKAKKKYYVQIRTYKTVNGTKYYSAWSGKKYVTTK